MDLGVARRSVRAPLACPTSAARSRVKAAKRPQGLALTRRARRYAVQPVEGAL